MAERSGLIALLPSLLIVDSAGQSWLRTASGLEALSAGRRGALERQLTGAPTCMELVRE